MRKTSMFIISITLLAVSGCTESAKLPASAGFGPKPDLSQMNKKIIATINVAKAVGWPENTTPKVADGNSVTAFAINLEHPRWLYELPNGDVLVAETNHKEKSDSFSVKAWIAGKLMANGGAAVPSANKIMLLRDTNGDGVADEYHVFLKNLNSPFGMSLIGDTFYVANADAVIKFPYKSGETEITAAPTKVIDLPAGRNHHWTKNILASPDGNKLYVSVGSNSNIADHGLDEEKDRAAIWEVDLATGTHKIFASGLRNPNGLVWEPNSGALWTVVNERDELGSDLVPDYMTSVSAGGFYGWPYSYYGQHVDDRVQPQNPELVAKAIVPDYALGAHTASLGLTPAKGNALSPQFANGMFIGQHGSWNRKPYGGYKVIFVPFADGKPNGEPIDVLTGFINNKAEAQGRPVGVIVNKKGALLVADDVGNTIWTVRATQ
ncbi:MAG: sorbosone dehydrogenase family protein [Methylophilaceae bacterium]|nr:sorbosone dehydrogenase family protein [Methylophilaceae bacterium]